MKLSEELKWRGFVNQTTYDDLAELDNKKIVFYHGFDASAESQTIGNLAAMMLDKIFMRHGHKAIILAGGATSMIGDPGGKDKERQLQDEQTIARNVANAEKQLSKIFEGHDYTLVNNLDWTKDLTLIEFLRDIGKHYSMTTLVQRDYIAQRIGEGGSGISYTEFSYTLLQGYDYLHLYDQYGCTLQLGGSDQWGNCLSGVDLIRRARGAETNVITLPLVINKATGKKFGKSEDGAVWLDEQLTSAYRFYQFWLNVDDEGVEDYIKIYTELSKEEVDGVMAEFNADRAGRAAQKRLAYEVTKIVHGQERTEEVLRVTEVLFGRGDFLELSESEKQLVQAEFETVQVHDDVPQVIVDAGLAGSKTEARNFLNQNAIAINNQKVNLDSAEFKPGLNLLQRGKNKFAIVQK